MKKRNKKLLVVFINSILMGTEKLLLVMFKVKIGTQLITEISIN